MRQLSIGMDIRQLKTLIAIAEYGTFARAAEAIHLTPSAVSQQMQSLEVEVGHSLFNRSTRPPSLNTQGLQMLEAAKVLVQTAAEAIDAINGNRVTGVFTIGSVRTSVFGLLPRALADLKSEYPDLKICLKTGLSDELLVHLAAGRLDAALVAEHASIPPKIRWNAFIREPLSVISLIGAKKNDAMGTLNTNPYISLNTNVPLAHVIDTEIARMGIALAPAMEVDTVAAIVACVEAGLGVAVVPRIAIDEHNSIMAVPFGDPPVFRQVGLAERMENPRAELVRELHTTLATLSAEYGLLR